MNRLQIARVGAVSILLIAFMVPCAYAGVDPGLPQEGQFVVPASRYYATGGTASDHDYAGVDTFAYKVLPNARPLWGPTFIIGLWHTKDWVVYHIPARGAPLEGVEVCMRNPKNPVSESTPVGIYVTAGPALPPRHDSDLAAAGWTLAGQVNLTRPRALHYKKYLNYTVLPGNSSFSVGISLKNGEIGPELGNDRNVEIAWVKIYA